MATGDKLFLADKETLDSVKKDTESLLQGLETSTEKTNEIDSKVDEVKQAVTENQTDIELIKSGVTSLLRDKDTATPFTVSNLNKLYYMTQMLQGTIGTVTAVNLTQPGTLYLVYVTSAANYQTTVDVIVDGTNIYRYNQTNTNVSYAGLVTSPSILGVNSTSNFVLTNNKTLPVNLAAPINRNYSGVVVLSMKPIKFNTSLVVRGTVSGTGVGSVDIYYELD